MMFGRSGGLAIKKKCLAYVDNTVIFFNSAQRQPPGKKHTCFDIKTNVKFVGGNL
jgi:hypothetical protein